MIPPLSQVPAALPAAAPAAPAAAVREELPLPRLDSATISEEALALLRAEAAGGT